MCTGQVQTCRAAERATASRMGARTVADPRAIGEAPGWGRRHLGCTDGPSDRCSDEAAAAPGAPSTAAAEWGPKCSAGGHAWRGRSREAAHRPRRGHMPCVAFAGVLTALCLAAAVGGAAAETERIYEGGTAMWYDSFDDRLSKANFPGTTYCMGRKINAYGKENCEVVPGCCWIPPKVGLNGVEDHATEQCVTCQDIRGTWQGVLGTCVYKDIETVVSFDIATNMPSQPVKTTRCVPTVVDPSLLVFKEADGKMATGVSPSSAANNGGRFAFDFQYSRNETSGELDILVATFLGSRIIFGRYEVEESELGSSLYMALGVTRSPSAKPHLTSAVEPSELMYVYFEGFRIDEFMPAVDTYPAKRLPSGSCKHVVTPGDDMDSISRRYMLTWQEIYAFNSHVYEPENLKPGDFLAVGRHHEVKGPCVNYHLRQNGVAKTMVETDYTCTCTSTNDCIAAQGTQKGETLYAIATRYGTSWQRVVDMNPAIFGTCEKSLCVITPGDHLCVVPYLRNIVCETEYRRFPVLDNNGNSPGYLQTFFSCNPKWTAQLTVDKCCQTPRCPCCTADKYQGYEAKQGDYET